MTLRVSTLSQFTVTQQQDSLTCLQIIGEPPRPELQKTKAPKGFDTGLKHALVEEAAHMFDLEHDPVMVCDPYCQHLINHTWPFSHRHTQSCNGQQTCT